MSENILTPFFNRAGESFDPAGWFHLVAKGDHPLTIKPQKAGDKPRRVIQRVDDAACAAMFTNFQNRLQQDSGFRLLVDFEHFSHDTEKASEAAGWITAMENRADGIWFKSDWSDLGETAIKNRRYRTISPVWFPHQCELISEGVYRPLQVNDAGLTNKNNLQGLVPFWNRADSLSGLPANEKQNNNAPIMNTRLLAILAFASTATEDQIVAGVEALKNRAIEAERLLTLEQSSHTALKNRHTSLLTVSVDRTLEEFKGVITEEGKPAWKNRLEADFEGTTAMLKGIKPAATTTKAPLHKPGSAAAAAAKKGGEGGGEETPFLNRVATLETEKGLSRSDAMAAAVGENESWYGEYRTELLRDAE